MTRKLYLALKIVLFVGLANALFCALFWPFSVGAQEPEYKEYGVKEGLSVKRQMFRVLEDANGFLWINGSFGVCRFDGYDFTYYDYEDGLLDHLVLRGIRSYDDRLWYQLNTGELLELRDNRFYPYKLNTVLRPVAQQNSMISFGFTRDRTLHIGLRAHGYKSLDSSGVVTTHLASHTGRKGIGVILPEGLDKALIFGLLDSNSVEQENYCYLFSAEGEVLFYFELPSYYSAYSPKAVLQLQNGNYLLVVGHAVVEFSEKGIVSETTTTSNIMCSFEDSDGGIWIGTSRKGLYYYPTGNVADPPQRMLPNTYIHDVGEDHEGGIWLVTNERNLLHLARKNDLIHQWTLPPVAENLRPNISVTDRGIYFHSDPIGKLQRYRHGRMEEVDVSSLSSRQYGPFIQTHFWDSTSHRLYMGGMDFLAYLDTNDKASVVEGADSLRTTGHQRGFVKSQYSDTIWAVFNNVVFALKDGRIVGQLPHLEERILCMVERGKGELLFAGERGLWYYQNGTYTHTEVDHEICRSRIYKLACRNDEIWMHTGSFGIAVLQGDTLLRSFGDVDVYGFQFDEDVCWGDNRYRMIKNNLLEDGTMQSEYYTVLHNQENIINRFLLYNDTFFLATTKGLMCIPKSELKQSVVPPIIQITQVKVNGIDTAILDDYALKHDQDMISIRYTGNTYQTSGRTFYKYRMVGVDEAWQITEERSVMYPKLPPGVYRFELLARSQDNVWNDEPVTLSFTIHPPFWETWWFRISVGLLLVGAITWFVRWQIQKNQAKTEAEFRVAQRFTQLELKALQAQMNPHFMFNTMNSIQHYIVENDSEKAQQFLGRFAQLIRKILDQADRDYITLAEEIEALEIYLELESIRFEGKFSYQIKVDESLDASFERIPPMLTQPYVENAIWHGLMHKQGSGRLSIAIKKVGEELEFVVEDNGIGRKAAREINRQNPRHRSKGMLINQERLELLYTKIKKRANVVIQDLHDSEGSPTGTQVAFRVPLH